MVIERFGRITGDKNAIHRRRFLHKPLDVANCVSHVQFECDALAIRKPDLDSRRRLSLVIDWPLGVVAKLVLLTNMLA